MFEDRVGRRKTGDSDEHVNRTDRVYDTDTMWLFNFYLQLVFVFMSR